MKDSQLPNIETDLHLDFEKQIHDIPSREKYYNNDLKDIAIRKVDHQEIYGDSRKWTLTHPHYQKVTTSDNTLSAMEKIRESVIREYQAKGYKIYQLDFNPDLKGGLNYNYYNKTLAKYVNWTLERNAPLSPLWIPYYKQGEIRQLLAALNDNAVVQQGGYLTIESTDKKSDAQTNRGSSGGGGTIQKKEDNTDWAAYAAVKQMEADALEAEGDKLQQLGTLYIMQALEKYKLAMRASPSARVQQKIDGIESQLALGKAMADGIEGLERGSEKVRQSLDGAGLPRFRAGQFGYTGFEPGTKSTDPAPWAIHATYGFYRIFAMEAGLFYGQSPAYDLYLVNKNGDKTGQVIQAYQQYAGIQLLGGLAIPGRNVVVYAMYGGNLPFDNTAAKLITPGYTYEEAIDNLNTLKFQGMAKLGVHLRIPKTRIGFSIFYSMNTVKGDNVIDEDSPYGEVKQGTNSYQVGGTVKDKYTYNQVGLSFLLIQKKK